jgi:hypothetical protein
MKYVTIAKETIQDFYFNIDAPLIRSRRRDIVLPKIAISNVLFKIVGPTELGRQLRMDHSTILYYIRTHDDRMLYDDYKELYKKAVDSYERCKVKYKFGEATSIKKMTDFIKDDVLPKMDRLDAENAIHDAFERISWHEKESLIKFASMFTTREIAEKNYEVIFR